MMHFFVLRAPQVRLDQWETEATLDPQVHLGQLALPVLFKMARHQFPDWGTTLEVVRFQTESLQSHS